MTQRSVAGLAIGLGLIGLAAVIGFDTWRMRVPPTYAKVGPQVFPVIVTLGLALAGAVIAWTSRAKPLAAEGETTDWIAVAIICGALVLHLNLLKPVGFIPASALLFFAVAFAFGSRRYLRDALIAIVLSVLVYLGFVHGLGLRLPAGLLESVTQLSSPRDSGEKKGPIAQRWEDEGHPVIVLKSRMPLTYPASRGEDEAV